ncbi:MAG: hypothetical protein Q9201_007081 [Fulgogasparrea decipioides]
MTSGKADAAAAETIYTPQRRGAKRTENQQIPWTERVARNCAKAPVRRLSASEKSRPFCSTISPPRGTFGEHWRSKHHLREGANAATFFGFPTTITPQPHMPGELDLDAFQSYTKYGHMAAESLGNDDYLDFGGSDTFTPIEYPSRYDAKNELRVRFAEEEDTTDGSDFEGSSMTLAEQVRNAFAIHALNQSVGVGLLNEFASHGQKLKLTLRPRTRILGHNASLWLKDYTFDTFRCLAAALVLHEQQTWGYPKTGHSAKDKPKLNFVVDIEKPGETKTYKINTKRAAAKTNFDKYVLPAIREGDSDKVRIRVRTEVLDCAFDCGCYQPGELEFEAPDYGSLRVVADWHLWHRREVENSLTFEETFLDQIFPPAAHAGQPVFDLELPDGQTFPIIRSADPSEIPTLNAHVQDALSRTVASVTKENIKEKTIKVWIRAESPTQALISRSQESPSQKSPGLARANGTILVYRPARVTQFRYDAPHTMQRFFALVRTHLYPDAPEHGLRLRISPSDASRKEGNLLAPIVESQEGYTKPDKVGQSLEDYWKDDFLRNYLSAEEDPWAVRVLESIKVFNGTVKSDVFQTWDTHLYYMGKEIRDATSDWNKPPKSLMDGLARISKSLLDIDPRESELGIVLHVKREAPVGQRKEWLQWSKNHSLTEFLTEVLYKIDGDEVAIYPGDYEESNDLTVLRMKETAENMRRTRKTGSRTNGPVSTLSTHRQTPARAHAVQDLLPATTRSSHLTSSSPAYSGLGPSARLPPLSDPVMLQFDTTTRPQTYSATEISLLRHRLYRTENELRLREESCRVCGKVFMASAESADAIRDHYQMHRPPPPRRCPHEGCLENLEDRARYPSFDQYEEHLRIHPIESAARSSIRRITRDTAPDVPAQITVREHASTQTDHRERWEEPQERSSDSLKQLPKATSEERGRLRCSVCHSYVDHLTAWDLDDHAAECGTTRDNFYIVPNIRPGKSNFDNERELNAAPKPKQTRSRATKRRAETPALTVTDEAEGGDASAAPRPTKRTRTQYAPRRGGRNNAAQQPATASRIPPRKEAAVENATGGIEAQRNVGETTGKGAPQVVAEKSTDQTPQPKITRSTRATSAPAAPPRQSSRGERSRSAAPGASPQGGDEPTQGKPGSKPSAEAAKNEAKATTVASTDKPLAEGDGVTPPKKRGSKAKAAPAEVVAPNPQATTAPTDTERQAAPQQSPSKKTRGKRVDTADTRIQPGTNAALDTADQGPRQQPPASKARGRKRKADNDEAADSSNEPQEHLQQNPVKKARITKGATERTVTQSTTTAAGNTGDNTHQTPSQQPPVRKPRGRKRKADEDEPTVNTDESKQLTSLRPIKKLRAALAKKAKTGEAEPTPADTIAAATETEQPAPAKPAAEPRRNATSAGETAPPIIDNTATAADQAKATKKATLKLRGPKASTTTAEETTTPALPAHGNSAVKPTAPPAQPAAKSRPRKRKAEDEAAEAETPAAVANPKATTKPPAKRAKVETATAPPANNVAAASEPSLPPAAAKPKAVRKPRTQTNQTQDTAKPVASKGRGGRGKKDVEATAGTAQQPETRAPVPAAESSATARQTETQLEVGEIVVPTVEEAVTTLGPGYGNAEAPEEAMEEAQGRGKRKRKATPKVAENRKRK